MKNPNVRTRYMIPMRLWSVVVNQPSQPRGGRVTSWATIWGPGCRPAGAVWGAAFRGCLGGGGGADGRSGGFRWRPFSGRLGVGGGVGVELLAAHGGGAVGLLDLALLGG